MKNVILSGLIFFASICFINPVKAQYMSLGPSIGGGVSWITNSGFDQSPRFTWNGGATFVYSTESHLGFGADLKFSQEGYMASYAVSGEQFDNTQCLNYLRLPLRFIYFFGEYGQSVRPKVFVGPTLGLLLSASSSSNSDEYVDVKNNYNSFDAGLHAGAGVNIRLAERIWLNTDITYYQGLLDITDDDVSVTDQNNLNGNVAVNVGVAFGFGGTTGEE